MVTELSFESDIAAASALAEDLASCLNTAVGSRGQALMAVSGGRPRRVFARLRELSVNWNRVTATLTDERWVPTDNPDSNAGLVSRYLPESMAHFVPLYVGEHSPQAGQVACEARLKALPQPLDAIYLGMGADGHFASLFPHDLALRVREGLFVAIPEQSSRLARMSLTVPMILSAKNLFLLITGSNKIQKYEQAKLPGSPCDLPLRLLLSDECSPLNVYSVP